MPTKLDIFKDLSNFSHDEVPEEASQKAKDIAKHLESLDIKQVQLQELLESQKKIGSNVVFECIKSIRKES